MGTTKNQGGSSGTPQGAERPLWSFPADGNSDWGDPTEIPAWAHSVAASAAPPPEDAPGPPEAKPAFGERSGYAGRSSARTAKRGAAGANSWGGGRSSQAGSKRASARTPRTREKRPADAAEPVELSDEQYATKGRAILLRQLTASAKSRAQLKTKLLEKEIPERIAEEILDRFEEIQLVDDEAFAEGWVRSRARSRGLARGAIKRELREKGVDDETAQQALEQIDDTDEEERARELVRTKLRPESMGADRDRALRRLVGMLARKGYGGSMAFRIAREEWEVRFGEQY